MFKEGRFTVLAKLRIESPLAVSVFLQYIHTSSTKKVEHIPPSLTPRSLHQNQSLMDFFHRRGKHIVHDG